MPVEKLTEATRNINFSNFTIQNSADDGITGLKFVSNQGTVSGSNFANVLTDDPAVGGAADPTLTPVFTTPNVSVADAQANEPASGSARYSLPSRSLLRLQLQAPRSIMRQPTRRRRLALRSPGWTIRRYPTRFSALRRANSSRRSQ